MIKTELDLKSGLSDTKVLDLYTSLCVCVCVYVHLKGRKSVPSRI